MKIIISIALILSLISPGFVSAATFRSGGSFRASPSFRSATPRVAPRPAVKPTSKPVNRPVAPRAVTTRSNVSTNQNTRSWNPFSTNFWFYAWAFTLFSNNNASLTATSTVKGN